MTDHDLEIALKDLSKSVTDHRYEIGRDLATLTANVGTLQTSHETNAKKLDEVLRLEIGCAARAGWDGMVGRVAGLEEDGKVRIESELERARDEITGQQDVMQRRIGERNYSETPTGRFFKMITPYLWKGLVILGITIGVTVVSRCTGEDPATTANALRAVTDMMVKTAAEVEFVKETQIEVLGVANGLRTDGGVQP